MAQSKIKSHGGAREGAGRPKKEPTKTLAYRVPEKLAGKIDKAIRKIISSMSKNKGITKRYTLVFYPFLHVQPMIFLSSTVIPHKNMF